jgi:hypothetical protein
MNFYLSFKSLNLKFIIYILSILITFIINSSNLRKSILAYILTLSSIININIIINLSLILKVSLVLRIIL